MLIIYLCISLSFFVFIFIVYIKQVFSLEREKISIKESIDLTNFPIVTFINNNKKLNFLLDTGSTWSYINKSLTDELDIRKVNERTIAIGVTGSHIESDVCIMSVSYKDNNFEESFNIQDLNSVFDEIKQSTGVQLHGILGNSFFTKYQYVIDFNNLIVYSKRWKT